MSIARHHAEWLSLLEIDGPFLSMPVLLRAFPQGLYADDPELARELRLAYEEWLDNQGGLQADPAIHRAWVLWVLRRVLGMPDAVLAGAAGGADERLEALAVAVAEQHETLRPDFAVLDPEAPAGEAAEDSAPRARLLLMLVPPGQSLERPLAGRHWKASPATRMMTLLHARGLRLGMVTNGERWMLVDAPRGGTTAFISWYARLWLDERLTQRALRSLLGPIASSGCRLPRPQKGCWRPRRASSRRSRTSWVTRCARRWRSWWMPSTARTRTAAGRCWRTWRCRSCTRRR
ncbi:MAG: hypothetical protein IPL60_02870 [Ardenticatenia bacterium]|nr:hypothetical protein [Ardenticatenia bacterium]